MFYRVFLVLYIYSYIRCLLNNSRIILENSQYESLGTIHGLKSEFKCMYIYRFKDNMVKILENSVAKNY